MPPEDLNLPDITGMNVVGIQELAASLSRRFGGVEGVARSVKETYDDPNTTPTVRSQISIWLTKVFAQANEAKGKVDYQTMSTDQLKAYFNKLVASHQGSMPQSWSGSGQA